MNVFQGPVSLGGLFQVSSVGEALRGIPESKKMKKLKGAKCMLVHKLKDKLSTKIHRPNLFHFEFPKK